MWQYHSWSRLIKLKLSTPPILSKVDSSKQRHTSTRMTKFIPETSLCYGLQRSKKCIWHTKFSLLSFWTFAILPSAIESWQPSFLQHLNVFPHNTKSTANKYRKKVALCIKERVLTTHTIIQIIILCIFIDKLPQNVHKKGNLLKGFSQIFRFTLPEKQSRLKIQYLSPYTINFINKYWIFLLN